MTAPVTPSQHRLSRAARNLQWLLANLVEEVPGLLSVAVVSSDGLLLLSSDPARDAHSVVNARAATGTHASPEAPGAAGTGSDRIRAAFAASSADLATIVSGLGSLTFGAAKLMDAGKVKQTVVAMREGNLCVMAISDGSLLGVHATTECDMSIVAYHMAFFVSRAGHVLTPELRSELRQSMVQETAVHGPAAAAQPQFAGGPTGSTQ